MYVATYAHVHNLRHIYHSRIWVLELPSSTVGKSTNHVACTESCDSQTLGCGHQWPLTPQPQTDHQTENISSIK